MTCRYNMACNSTEKENFESKIFCGPTILFSLSSDSKEQQRSSVLQDLVYLLRAKESMQWGQSWYGQQGRD